MTAAWRRVLSHHIVPLSRTTSLVPFGLAPDGRSFFAVVRSPRFSGVARIGSGAHSMTEIKAFPAPNTYQADGGFDGRWFVWYEYHGFSTFDDFKIYAWDSRTGRVKLIGAAARGPTGELWPSPWQGPDVRNGLATWAQGSGPDGLSKGALVRPSCRPGTGRTPLATPKARSSCRTVSSPGPSRPSEGRTRRCSSRMH